MFFYVLSNYDAKHKSWNCFCVTIYFWPNKQHHQPIIQGPNLIKFFQIPGVDPWSSKKSIKITNRMSSWNFNYFFQYLLLWVCWMLINVNRYHSLKRLFWHLLNLFSTIFKWKQKKMLSSHQIELLENLVGSTKKGILMKKESIWCDMCWVSHRL